VKDSKRKGEKDFLQHIVPYSSPRFCYSISTQLKSIGIQQELGKSTKERIAPMTRLWKQPRCPTTDEWIKKMWYLYTMEFYAVMKKNEILSFASKWMGLENIILSEVSLA
jgi:hypothetical protein